MLGDLLRSHDTKKAALIKASVIAPDECWQKSKRASKPHDGMVDAFLIAHYIRREFAFDRGFVQ